jgi:hypothetical protein
MFKRIPDCAIIYNWDVSNTYKHRPYANQSINMVKVIMNGGTDVRSQVFSGEKE